jgi:hypothetical protein
MNAKIFEKWVKDQLLPALNALHKPCVIVMDNAPYHSQQLDKAPVASAKKDDMKTWLNNHNIPYPPEALKKDLLWEIIRDRR